MPRILRADESTQTLVDEYNRVEHACRIAGVLTPVGAPFGWIVHEGRGRYVVPEAALAALHEADAA